MRLERPRVQLAARVEPRGRPLGAAVDRLVFEPSVRMVWTYVLQADLDRAATTMDELDDLIDTVRLAREADVACLLKQQPDGRFKVRLRSRGASDVGKVALAFGGGGHRPDPSLDEQLEAMLEQYEEMLQLYGTHTGVNLARKHIGWYTKGLPGSAELRNTVNQQDDPRVVVRMLREFYAPWLQRDAA